MCIRDRAGVAVLSPNSAMHGPGLAVVAAGASTLGLVGYEMRRQYALTLPWRRLGLAVLATCPLIITSSLLGSVLRSSGRGWAVVALVPPLAYCLYMAAVFAEVVRSPLTRVHAVAEGATRLAPHAGVAGPPRGVMPD